MSIINKLGHKYKFLRFFNKKVTKLSLLGVALIGLCVSSSVSFAKYIESARSSNNAQLKYGIFQATGEDYKEGVVDAALGSVVTYKLNISNYENDEVSEVPLTYSIYIDLPINFPLMDISVSDAILDEENSTNETKIYISSKILPALEKMDVEHTITFSGTLDTIGFYEDLNVNVRIIAEQVNV